MHKYAATIEVHVNLKVILQQFRILLIIDGISRV